jgi:hypothetical protein
MARTVGGHKVSEAVTVKIYIADSAVRFWAKHSFGLGIREARKKLAAYLLEHGSYVDTLMSDYLGPKVIEWDELEEYESDPSLAVYEGNGTRWFRVEVK